MAKQLNKNRIRLTKLVLILSLILTIFTVPLERSDTPGHEVLDMLGSLLIGACAMGRLFCTAFLGGYKNQSLITYGPFSVSRNPLYFCSFLGACGIALISNHLTLMVVIPGCFLLVYLALIAREEGFLREHFGEEYAAYCARVPRFFPKFHLYTVPETVPMVPKYMVKALKDSVLWFCVLPFFEVVEKLQDMGFLHAFFTLP